ncbi:MAG: pyrroline-5-carboxylate reductase [Chloroflexi bacterium]|nr:MAG: pyrroline-5-carboxylate reductase [Chloroflexota bacterium]
MSPLRESTLSVIGAGVMAEAMIGGVLERELVPAGSIIASHPRADRRKALGEKYGIQVTADNAEAARRGDIVVLGIKPQVMPGVLAELRGSLAQGKLVISIIAGATTETLGRGLDHGALVRVMPNTPAQIGEGVNIWYATPETTEVHREQARALLGALGHELQVGDERFVAMATAVSGTGPTYVFLVMEALIDSAVHLGFPRHLAHDLVLETIKGSVAFAERTQKHPAQLRDMVTSPGGTSAAAIYELERGRLRTVLADAVWAAYRRTMSLSDSLSAGKDPEPMPPGSRS